MPLSKYLHHRDLHDNATWLLRDQSFWFRLFCWGFSGFRLWFFFRFNQYTFINQMFYVCWIGCALITGSVILVTIVFALNVVLSHDYLPINKGQQFDPYWILD